MDLFLDSRLRQVFENIFIKSLKLQDANPDKVKSTILTVDNYNNVLIKYCFLHIYFSIGQTASGTNSP